MNETEIVNDFTPSETLCATEIDGKPCGQPKIHVVHVEHEFVPAGKYKEERLTRKNIKRIAVAVGKKPIELELILFMAETRKKPYTVRYLVKD